MKRQLLKTCCILAVLLSGFSAHSQSIIYDTLQRSEFSIIRNYNNNVDITFNYYADSYNCFIYIDRSGMTTYSAKVPDFITVLDFVVYGDSVFYCGLSGDFALYGYFDINDVFFSGGSITYFLVSAPASFNLDTTELAVFNRIEVKKTPYGETHILLVGTGIGYDPVNLYHGSHYYHPAVFADVLISIYGNNLLHYIIDEDYDYLFDDVAITDNNAIVSGHSVSTSAPDCRYAIFYYKEPLVTGNTYFSAWNTISGIQIPLWEADMSVLTLPSTDNVRIVKMEQDGFATVCQRYDVSGNYPYTLSIYSDPSLPPTSRYDIPYNDGCRELVYNTKQNTLYIMPGLSDNIFYTKDPFPSTSQVSVSIHGINRWTSIDNADNEACVMISGYEHGSIAKLRLWRYDELDINQCINKVDSENSEPGIYESAMTKTLTEKHGNLHPDYFVPNISRHKLNILCASSNNK